MLKIGFSNSFWRLWYTMTLLLCMVNRELHYVNEMKTVQKLCPDVYPDTDDYVLPHC